MQGPSIDNSHQDTSLTATDREALQKPFPGVDFQNLPKREGAAPLDDQRVLIAEPAGMRVKPPKQSTNQSLEYEMEGMLAKMQSRIDAYEVREQALMDQLQLLERQVETASQLQRSLMTTPLPETKGVNLELFFKPLDISSGDLYSVVRLDETHVAISLADATGHGLPAAFLSIYAKQLLSGRWLRAGLGSVPDPAAVLGRLNEVVLDSALADCQFLAVLYAILNEKNQTIRWSRGGMPYPILTRKGEKPRALPGVGPVVGALPDPHFEVSELVMQPGDRLALFTDGLAALLSSERGDRCGSEIANHPWFAACSDKSVSHLTRSLRRRLSATPRAAWDADDVTVIMLGT